MRCEEVRQHVAACEACRAEYGGFEELWQALADVPAGPVPSDRMRERFSALLATDHAGTDEGTRPRLDPAGMRSPLLQVAMAATLLLVGALAGRVVALRPTQPSTEIADVRSELHEMRQMLTLSLMQQSSATERLRGVSWTAQIDQPNNDVVAALLDTLLRDPSVNVRLAAVDALRRFSSRDDVRQGTQRAAADISSPLLQIAVIDYLVETHDRQAVGLLQRLSGDASVDESVRGRAVWGLERLSS